MSFSLDGRWLAVLRLLRFERGSSSIDNVKLWNLEMWRVDTGTKVQVMTEPYTYADSDPSELIWSPDSSRLFLRGDQKTLRITVDRDGKMHASPQELSSLWNVIFAGKRRLFLTTNQLGNAEAILWDFSGRKIWSKTLDSVVWAAFSADDTALAIETVEPNRDFTISTLTVDLSTTGKPSEKTATLLDYQKFPMAWANGAPRQLLARLEHANRDLLGGAGCSQTAVDAGRQELVCLHGKRPPLVFDVRTFSRRGELSKWDFSDSDTPTISDAGSLLAAWVSRSSEARLDYFVTVWDLVQGTELWTRRATTKGQKLLFSSDAKRLFVEDGTGSVSVHDARTGSTTGELKQAAEIVWIDAGSSRAITRSSRAPNDRSAQSLTYWDVERSTVIRTVTMAEIDAREAREDQKELESRGTAEKLIAIAKRRLRSCGG
jgi:hypothetical protein